MEESRAMKKNNVLRNDSPHAVKIQEGSNVAARKTKKVAAVKEPAKATAPPKSKTPSPVAEATPVPVKAPKRSSKPARKVQVKKQAVTAEAPAKLTEEASSATPLSMAAEPPPPLDPSLLWEQDSPVKLRLSQLKTRNALLDEQLHRLKSPFQVRGLKP